jgi:hypothetical protein
MNLETTHLEKNSGQLNALLEGGPVDLPAGARERTVEPGASKIKLPFNGGYEHFERTDQQSAGYDGRPRQIYRWVDRTRIAE